MKKAIEIEKFPENYNREDGWNISKTWLLIIYQEKTRHVIRKDVITTRAATIATNKIFRCREGRIKYEECQKQHTDKINNNT